MTPEGSADGPKTPPVCPYRRLPAGAEMLTVLGLPVGLRERKANHGNSASC
ncbi:hypothetical protein I2I05_08005 [Hymenobacter sp. BT683]|uniref:Uncharacterized protein n=1 Tax=Hymenobacter jeongseonensis TaxID=2791027 RepID=A0ABS0IG50_9BACT|nr:hypothetical protein [Hymenobacter jeongseonensis]MBF9237339.1 hypothetical protein [Hymenobacter jeongseonensis]